MDSRHKPIYIQHSTKERKEKELEIDKKREKIFFKKERKKERWKKNDKKRERER